MITFGGTETRRKSFLSYPFWFLKRVSGGNPMVEESPEGMDLKIESEAGEAGLREVRIIALTQQGEIDLAMEYPRFLKLLERNWTAGAE
jgi:hypothetical protein